MKEGDAVFAADGAHVGRVEAVDGDSLSICGDHHTYRVPREEVAEESDGRIFLSARNRAAARLWRVDVAAAGGLRGWWQRRVLGPSPRTPGGRLDD